MEVWIFWIFWAILSAVVIIIDIRNTSSIRKYTEESEERKRMFEAWQRQQEEQKRKEEEQKQKEEKAAKLREIKQASQLFLSQVGGSSYFAKCVRDWEVLHEVKSYFFYYYYPVRYEDVSPTSNHARQLIWDFKNGQYYEIASMVTDLLKRTFDTRALPSLTFVCIPASNSTSNRQRYYKFCDSVCSSTHMKNGYQHITIISSTTPTHLGGTKTLNFRLSDTFFQGENVIIFDDIVTRGRSLRMMVSQLKSAGANVVCAVFAGKTISDFEVSIHPKHPFTRSN